MNETSARGADHVRARVPTRLGHPLIQLTLVRIREFVREPEAIFWAIFFPILLTAGLGIAFRSESVDALTVVTSDAAIAESLRRDPGLYVQHVDDAAARAALRTGKAALLAAA